MDVGFEFFNMDLGDFHAIRTFLVQAFGQRYTEVVDAGAIAKLITEDLSEDVGTTIKVEGEGSDAYGYATLVPLALPEGSRAAVASLKALLLKTCPREQQERLKADLERAGSSLVFMERFVNLPADLASPLFKQLLDDMGNAVKEEPIFKTERVFISTPTYVEVQSHLQVEVEHEGKKQKKAKVASSRPASTCKFYYEECEMLEGLCEYQWGYKVDQADRVSDSKRAFGDLGIESSRRVYCLSWDKFCRFINSIEKYVSE